MSKGVQMDPVFSKLATRLLTEGRVALESSKRWWHVRIEVSQVYSTCEYSCTVIIKIALAPAPTCSSCPSLIQLHQRGPKGVSRVLRDSPAGYSHPTAVPCTSCAQAPLLSPFPRKQDERYLTVTWLGIWEGEEGVRNDSKCILCVCAMLWHHHVYMKMPWKQNCRDPEKWSIKVSAQLYDAMESQEKEPGV